MPMFLFNVGSLTPINNRANPQAGSVSSQTESADSQAANAFPPQAGSSLAESADSQAASAVK